MNRAFFYTVGGGKLPYKRRVEYLESSNGCYIDSGIVPDTETTVKCKYDLIGFGDNGGAVIFGQTATAGTRANMFGLGPAQVRTHLYRFYGNIPSYFGSNYSNSNLVYHQGALWVDGEQVSQKISSTFITDKTLFIFAENYGRSAYRAGRIKLFYLQILDGSQLARDYIPVIDWNDVPCLYDRVSKTLFYNQGTGKLYAPPQEFPQDGYSGVWLKLGSAAVSSGFNITYTDPIASGQVVDSAFVYNLGSLSSAAFGYWGYGLIYNGGYIQDFTIRQAGANMFVYAGGSANTGVISGGHLYIAGGTVTNLVASGGSTSVYSSGTLQSAVISSGGSLTVLTGAAIYDTVLSSGGTLTVNSGGLASGCNVYSSGRLWVYSGGSINDMEQWNPGANTSVFLGGSATEIAMHSGQINNYGYVSGIYMTGVCYVQGSGTYEGGTQTAGYAYLNGSANNWTLSGGNISLYQGTPRLTNLVQRGGNCHVRIPGAVVSGVIISGGTLYISSGCTALAVSSGGGIVNVLEGGSISYA